MSNFALAQAEYNAQGTKRNPAKQTTDKYVHPEVIASSEWLHEHLDDPSIRIVEGCRPQRGRAGYLKAGHIPGAVFLDIINELSDPQSSIPYMILPPDNFQNLMGKLGIDENITVVVYDQSGGMWAARVWWALRYYGHDTVMILDGGLTKWKLENRPLETDEITPTPATFTTQVRQELFSTVEDVVDAIGNPDIHIIDALPENTYLNGHIPTAKNVPAPSNIDPLTQTLLPVDELTLLWRGVAPESDQQIITYCGGGYYGAFDLFILYLLGYEHVSLYDGAWVEWTNDSDRPVETGMTSVKNEFNIPEQLSLLQNFPNPFNPKTTITYQLNQSGMVNLVIYDMLGRKVETLVDKVMTPGAHQVNWNAAGFASGVYFCRIQAGDAGIVTRKMLLLK